jgi:hypothetical protein
LDHLAPLAPEHEKPWTTPREGEQMPIIIPRKTRTLVGTPCRSLGIDPGTSGSAALLDGLRVERVVTWTASKATVYSALQSSPITVPIKNLWTALQLVRPGEVEAIALEFVRQLPGRSHGEVLVESAGYVRAWLDSLQLPEPQRPTSGDWRMDVLGVREASGAQACEMAAVAAYEGFAVSGGREHVVWGLERSGATLTQIPGHGAESVAMALHAQGWRLA